MELADKAKGVNGVEYGADFQAAQSESLVCNWVEYVWGNGGDILDENGTPVVNSENNVEATEIMKKLLDNYAPSGITTYSRQKVNRYLKKVNVSFIRDWSGFWSSGQDEGSKSNRKNWGNNTSGQDQVVKSLTPALEDLIS